MVIGSLISPSMNIDPFDIVRISLLPNIGPNRGRGLIAKFGNFENLLHAHVRDMMEIDGFEKTLASKTRLALHDQDLLSQIDQTIEKCERVCREKNIHLITYVDDEYPSSLKNIYDPPLYLFMRGEWKQQDEKSIAIVGTRAATPYGKHAVEKIGGALAEMGITIVSGLALGIDTIAHRVALEHSARTVAVLGNGVDFIYPDQNRKLAEKITESGCVMSELPLGAKPDAVNFPRRNRIISGLSTGVLVVETAIKGGSMITAHLATDQNKSVFAIPGNIFDAHSSGTNFLIKTNLAKLVQTADDILEDLPQLTGKRMQPHHIQLTIFEENILKHLDGDPVQIDHLAELSSLSISDLLVQLLQLEFKGVVRQFPGKMFARF